MYKPIKKCLRINISPGAGHIFGGLRYNNLKQDLLSSPYFHALDNLSAACSSVLLLTPDGGATALTLAVGAGDDDEVTTSAGKKRKHWILQDVKG